MNTKSKGGFCQRILSVTKNYEEEKKRKIKKRKEKAKQKQKQKGKNYKEKRVELWLSRTMDPERAGGIEDRVNPFLFF